MLLSMLTLLAHTSWQTSMQLCMHDPDAYLTSAVLKYIRCVYSSGWHGPGEED